MESLFVEKEIEVRFNEVDPVGIVWHGSYATYFEMAREAFGKKYGLDYLYIFSNGCYAPLVDLDFHFKRPLRYPDCAIVVARYRPTPAAKIIFDYEIYHAASHELVATGSSVQVFIDKSFQLILSSPSFYEDWKIKNNVLSTVE